MSVFTHLSLSPINIAAALCSAKAYNSAYAKGEQMINETMYARGAESSIIREIFSYGLERKAQIGAENSFGGQMRSALFSLGNVGGDITIVVQSVLDGKIIGESVSKYNRQMQRAMGV